MASMYLVYKSIGNPPHNTDVGLCATYAQAKAVAIKHRKKDGPPDRGIDGKPTYWFRWHKTRRGHASPFFIRKIRVAK